MYYHRKSVGNNIKLTDKVTILTLIQAALIKKEIDLSKGGIINFFDRDGTINIENPELRDAIKNAKDGNVVAGTLTGKLPEELNDILQGFSFLGSAGGGMIYLPSIETKIPFKIPQDKLKEVERIYTDILKEYGINEDLIQGIHLQYNSYEEDIDQGMILLLSNNPVEKQDYLNRGTKEERLLKAEPEERFNKTIIEATAVQGGAKGKEILEKLYEKLQQVEGIKMVPPGFMGDRTGKEMGADITTLDKGDVFGIILDAFPDVMPHFMGNSTNDIPAVKAVWSRDEGIVSMVLPPSLEHEDTALISMIANCAEKYSKNLVLVPPGPDEEYGSAYATEILNNPAMLGEHLKSEFNLEKIKEYSQLYETMKDNGKVPQSIINANSDLEEHVRANKVPIITIQDIEESVSKTVQTEMYKTVKKLNEIAKLNTQLKVKKHLKETKSKGREVE